MPVAKVLRPFPYAADHVHAEQLVAGDERDFPTDLLPGLVSAGLVADPTAAVREADDGDPVAVQPAARRKR